MNVTIIFVLDYNIWFCKSMLVDMQQHKVFGIGKMKCEEVSYVFVMTSVYWKKMLFIGADQILKQVYRNKITLLHNNAYIIELYCDTIQASLFMLLTNCCYLGNYRESITVLKMIVSAY